MSCFDHEFWKFVEMRSDVECWLWKGAKSSGYGSWCGRGAHVRAYELFYLSGKKIPRYNKNRRKNIVCHKCDVKFCVNPHHLYLATNSENANDRYIEASIKKKRKLRFSEEGIKRLKDFYNDGHGVSMRWLAVMFGVSVTTISNAIKGKIYYKKIKETNQLIDTVTKHL